MADLPISKTALLRIAVLKEIRTTFRERSQIAAALLAVAMLAVVMTTMLVPAVRSARSRPMAKQPASTAPTTARSATEHMRGPLTAVTTAPTTEADFQAGDRPTDHRLTPDSMRWVATAAACLIGFFFSIGYLFAAVLATFVGEKEGRTLEVLLASPMTDLSLYLVKCVSVLIPSAGLAVIFCSAAMVVGALITGGVPRGPSASVFITAPLLAVPLVTLTQIWFVGIGAAISATAETMKGAGQTLGIVLLVLCGSLYGIPAVLGNFPPARHAVQPVAAWFLERDFIVQYLVAVSVWAIPAVVLLSVGRFCFRRDRMLT